jgi:hypothetical protein
MTPTNRRVGVSPGPPLLALRRAHGVPGGVGCSVAEVEHSQGFELRRDILPILVIHEDSSQLFVKSFQGTGFALGKNVFVTCHHCVATPLEEGDRYVVAMPVTDMYAYINLTDIEQSSTGLDLVTAKVPFDASFLKPATHRILVGDDVSTYGYPLIQNLPPPDAGRSISLEPRYLEGYCTLIFENDVPGYVKTGSYELDMLAPRGLSGAPILRRGTTEVVGVVYGTKDTGTIEEFSRVDEATGRRIPELQRITTFAVAHRFESLYDLEGRATEGLPLGEYLGS